MKTRCRKHWLSFIFFLCMLLFLPAAKAEAKVKLNYSSIALVKGSSKTLKIKGTRKKAKWKTSNSTIATVSEKGKVKAKHSGNVTITATVGGKKLKCKVKIVSLDAKTVVLPSVGSTKTLKVNNGSNTSWSSSNSCVKVSSKGVVTGKKSGVATITCKSRGKKMTCKVYVASLNASSIHIKRGQSFQFKLSNSYYKPQYISKNTDVASINASTGLCVGLKHGYATIRVINGSYTYYCSVLVTDDSDILTPTSWISSSTKKSKYTQKIQGPNGAVLSYNVFGQGYSSNKFKKNFNIFFDAQGNVVPPPNPTPEPPETDEGGETDPELNPDEGTPLNGTVEAPQTGEAVNGITFDYKKVSTYMGNHGCAACSTTTVLSGYVNFKDSPKQLISLLEPMAFTYKTWKDNYTKSSSKQMPLSLYGASRVFASQGIRNEYVRKFSTHSEALTDIFNHLTKGKPVLICVGTKNAITDKSSSRWTSGRHTMVLLGMTSNYKVIVADPADRGNSGFGNQGRIKVVDLYDVGGHLWSSSDPNNKKASSYYYENCKYNGGYVLVDK